MLEHIMYIYLLREYYVFCTYNMKLNKGEEIDVFIFKEFIIQITTHICKAFQRRKCRQYSASNTSDFQQPNLKLYHQLLKDLCRFGALYIKH